MSGVICNPLDLPYRYQDVRLGGVVRSVSREAADPSIVRYRGRYYMFASMSGGFWHSTDLLTWSFQATAQLPIYDYAPDVREINGYLVISASRRGSNSPFHRTADPLSGRFELVSPGTFAFWDPNMFQDDDGRAYFYWGCSNKEPMYGLEMNPATLTPIGVQRSVIDGHPDRHGWERTGENHDPESTTGFAKLWARLTGTAPFVEGAWMTKHDGRYYLQYAAPGTELNTYADGYYVGDSPLGPFTYADSNPFSIKPGGFITGAGHGSTFQDAHGNWWHASTMRVSVNFIFERRIGLFPAGFDEDGVLFSNQHFGDYPMIVPDGPIDPWTDTFAGWMLQSYRKPVTATSSKAGHGPQLAVNEDVRSYWLPETTKPGQSLTVDLGEAVSIRAVQVNLADHDQKRFTPKPPRSQTSFVGGAVRHLSIEDHPTEYVIETSDDGLAWTVRHDTRATGADAPHGFVVLEDGVHARYVRLTGYEMPFGGYFAVSGLRVFGTGNGAAPPATKPTARRVEGRNAALSWPASTGAHGYNVRWGNSPSKLYNSWLVYDATALDLSALTTGVAYWVAVDAFNENGVTTGDAVPIPAHTNRQDPS